jgi:hypothetical protein
MRVQRVCKPPLPLPGGIPVIRKPWVQLRPCHGGYGGVVTVWVESEIGGGGVWGREAGGSIGRCVWDFYATSRTHKAMAAAGRRLAPSRGPGSG